MENKFAGQIRVSASRIKANKQCSYKFYLNEIEKLPETTHPKTIAGSICHAIFESLKNPRHRPHYDRIVAAGTVTADAAVCRLIRMWRNRHKVPQDIIDPIDEMVMVGLTKIDFFNSGAFEVFPPEHEFKLLMETGIVKGFIDDLSFYGTVSQEGSLFWFAPVAKIRDYKSQKNKFTKEELKEEIQATVYQLYVWDRYHIPAEVEFVLLRHPPTKRHPNLHLQIVQPKTESQLVGFEYYLTHMATVFKNYGLKEAHASFAADDPGRKYFCQYICQFKNAFEYQSVVKDGAVVKNYHLSDDVKLEPGQSLEIRQHAGCPRFQQP